MKLAIDLMKIDLQSYLNTTFCQYRFGLFENQQNMCLCFQMTVEPPHGLKSNMLRAFGSGGTGVISEKMFEDATKSQAWKKLLFGLCLFNSVIHERKKYGALGWNIAYEFNDSDLEVCVFVPCSVCVLYIW